jgi:hypothetical protein
VSRSLAVIGFQQSTQTLDANNLTPMPVGTAFCRGPVGRPKPTQRMKTAPTLDWIDDVRIYNRTVTS